MNYSKLLVLGLLVTLNGQTCFGMHKPSTFLDFKTQALNWITENKTNLLLGSCALIAGGLLYKYWSTPKTAEQIKAKIKKDTRAFVQAAANDAVSTISYTDIRIIPGSYALQVTKFEDTQNNIGVKAIYTFACDNTTEELIVLAQKA